MALTESFFMDKDSDLYKAARYRRRVQRRGHFGAGGNVTKSFGNVVSVGGKYEFVLKTYQQHRLICWAGKSVGTSPANMSRWYLSTKLKKTS